MFLAKVTLSHIWCDCHFSCGSCNNWWHRDKPRACIWCHSWRPHWWKWPGWSTNWSMFHQCKMAKLDCNLGLQGWAEVGSLNCISLISLLEGVRLSGGRNHNSKKNYFYFRREAVEDAQLVQSGCPWSWVPKMPKKILLEWEFLDDRDIMTRQKISQ